MPKSKHQIPGRVRSSYEFIKAHPDTYSVEAMRRILEVAPSGYYEWLNHAISNRAQEDARLLRLIRASFVASHGIYGAPRVFLDLREAGETCSKHRVARLMRQGNLRALHGYRTKRWATGKPAMLVPNLLQRQFTATRPNVAWVTDITYIRTWHGWLYLAVVLDLFASRGRVGGRPRYSPGAGARRRAQSGPAPAARAAPPFTPVRAPSTAATRGDDSVARIISSRSMSRKGNCWDNAVAESFFSSLKKDRIENQIYENRTLALSDVADCIDFLRQSHTSSQSSRRIEP